MLLLSVLVFVVTQSRAIDSLRWVIAAFSLSAGTFFAVLVLSVWWRRLTAAGAFAGMISGFAVTALYLNTGGTPLFAMFNALKGAYAAMAEFRQDPLVGSFQYFDFVKGINKLIGADKLVEIEKRTVLKGRSL